MSVYSSNLTNIFVYFSYVKFAKKIFFSRSFHVYSTALLISLLSRVSNSFPLRCTLYNVRLELRSNVRQKVNFVPYLSCAERSGSGPRSEVTRNSSRLLLENFLVVTVGARWGSNPGFESGFFRSEQRVPEAIIHGPILHKRKICIFNFNNN